TSRRTRAGFRIGDTRSAYGGGAGPPPPLPAEMRPRAAEPEEEEASSTVEATLSENGKQILVTQPTEVLQLLLDISDDLARSIQLDVLLPKLADKLFQLFKQADRAFIILCGDEPNVLIPKVVRPRRGDETTARFSRSIVLRCLNTGQSVLSEDASNDRQIDLSQSIADCRIRSVMCVPLVAPNNSRPFGVIQLDTQ